MIHQSFFSGESCSHIVNEASITLVRLEEWTIKNCLNRNTDKTKALIYRPRNKVKPVHGDILFKSYKIELVSNFKTLGIHVSVHCHGTHA